PGPGADAGTDARAASAFVLLGGLAEVASVDAMLDRQRDGFRWARAVAETGPRLFVTVQDTGGGLGLDGRQGDRAWLGGFTALAATAAAEWPTATVKAIDCERARRGPTQLAAAIAAELCHGGAATVVALRADGTRFVPRVDPAPRPADAEAKAAPGARLAGMPGGAGIPASVLGPESVLVVTGGGRGVTAAAVT